MELRNGKKVVREKNFFPGYIIANMHLLTEEGGLMDRTWYFIKDTPGVIGFAGTKDRPTPMRPREVESMLAQIQERVDTVKP
ncbi:MAG: transcription termination/antitermination NusG family protein, partial [bacterium]